MLAPIDIFDASSYPTRRDEEWKYSDLSRVLRAAPTRVATPGEKPGEAELDIPTYEVFDGNYGEGIHAAIKRWVRLHIRHLSTGADDTAGIQGEARIVVPAGGMLTLFETYRSLDGFRPYAANTSLHITLGEGAKFTRIVILDEPETAVSIRRSTVETAPGSSFKQYVFSTGAKFQRFETHVNHAGHGAEVEMNGAYLLRGKRHFDLTTRVSHTAVNGVTAQLIKGLVKDNATAVFQGRILVEKGADGTDARMRHQALILTDGAHIRAKPELEIYADDVQCAHGNTIGALDEEALFFCQSRGLSEDQARALLTHAFVIPVAEAIADDDLRATVLSFLETESEAYHAV